MGWARAAGLLWCAGLALPLAQAGLRTVQAPLPEQATDRDRTEEAVVGATSSEPPSGPVSLTMTGSSTFGPKGCAQVGVSGVTGTCIIETQCETAEDLVDTDFSFICSNGDSAELHSYGNGGFAGQEVFDTGVKCEKCVARGEAAAYGPGGCLSTFQSSVGTCVVEARDCDPVGIEGQAVPFNCRFSTGEVQKYQLAAGALGASNAVDSRVRCAGCEAPTKKMRANEDSPYLPGSTSLRTIMQDIEEVSKNAAGVRKYLDKFAAARTSPTTSTTAQATTASQAVPPPPTPASTAAAAPGAAQPPTAAAAATGATQPPTPAAAAQPPTPAAAAQGAAETR